MIGNIVYQIQDRFFFPKFLQRDKKVVMKNREVRKIVGLENRASTEANKFIGQSHVLTNPYYNYIFCSFDTSLNLLREVYKVKSVQLVIVEYCISALSNS